MNEIDFSFFEEVKWIKQFSQRVSYFYSWLY